MINLYLYDRYAREAVRSYRRKEILKISIINHLLFLNHPKSFISHVNVSECLKRPRGHHIANDIFSLFHRDPVLGYFVHEDRLQG